MRKKLCKLSVEVEAKTFEDRELAALRKRWHKEELAIKKSIRKKTEQRIEVERKEE